MNRYSTWIVLSCAACSGQSMTHQGRAAAEECALGPCISKDSGTKTPHSDAEPDGASSMLGFDADIDDHRTGNVTSSFETTASDTSHGDTPSEVSSSNEATTTGDVSTHGAAETGSNVNTDATSCDGAGSRFATSVLDHRFGPGQNVNQDLFPDPIFGPPEANQTTSVVSLGNGGFVVVGFEGNAIIDGAGPDFTVFENPLLNFRELATVAVSEDGNTWHEFPCTADQDDSDFGSCAGVARVYSSSQNGIDPTDPAVSGGDPYDLADLGVTRARYVRITDRVDLVGGNADVFDLDAVAIINAECP